MLTRERFIIWSTLLMIAARTADVVVTYYFSPDLSHEGNPMVLLCGAGWPFLLSVNALIVLMTVRCTYCWAREPLQYDESPEVRDVWTFASFACFRRVYPPAHFVCRRLFCQPQSWKHTLQFFGVVLPPTMTVISASAVFSWLAMYGCHWMAFSKFYSACWPMFPYVLIVPTFWGSAALFYWSEYHSYQASHPGLPKV